MLSLSLINGIMAEIEAADTMNDCLDISKDIMTKTRDITTKKLNELFNKQFPSLREDPEGEEFE